MSPAPRLVWGLAIWTLLGLLPVWYGDLTGPWLALGAVLLVLVALDSRGAWRELPTVQRHVQHILPVGAWSPVTLRLDNSARSARQLRVYDHFPQPMVVNGEGFSVDLPADGWGTVEYCLRPLQRGEFHFPGVELVLDSSQGWWRRTCRLRVPTTVRVYPDFAAIANFSLMALQNRVNQIGVHRQRRRGEGQDFLQLREYRPGDSLRQIDWRATARQRKLIAREYQEERNQRLVFLLDCGRRMRTQDGELSHFDHALNALILLAYVGLNQGDAVGVQTFGAEERWVAPRSGPKRLNTLIGSLYDLQPGVESADYIAATEGFLRRQPKRSLVIVLTNLRDEDSSDLSASLRLLLRRHLVLVANLRETVLDELMAVPVDNFQAARRYAATCDYLDAREQGQRQLQALGGRVLDTPPRELPMALVNQYLAIKRSGRL